MVKPKQLLNGLGPLIIGILLSLILGTKFWWGFYLIFSWIGASISLGYFIEAKRGTIDSGRRVAISLIFPLFVIFLGVLQRENLQLEETVFYAAHFIAAGVFTRVLIHFAVAKIFGPFIWGRGFCGWACWTAALLEWLPIQENNRIPKKYTYLRIPAFALSLVVPFLLIQSGYDYYTRHIYGVSGAVLQPLKYDQFIWFLTGNALYYALGITLAFVFKKKRAFCKILCPIPLVMMAQTKFALIKKRPSNSTCIECGKCNIICPMDVEVMDFIKAGKPVASSECILCGACVGTCPVRAIQ